MGFLDARYLLEGEEAQQLFEEIRDLPILDPHNHADVTQLADNKPFENPWQLFAQTDHYVWEMMRKCGVPEDHITGDASPREKWTALATVFPLMAGNPVYEWVHLDLRFLGFHDVLLGPETADFLWTELSRVLASDECRPRALVRRMNIETMCSTDDPVDLLQEHDRANAAFGSVVIRPTWRPDQAVQLSKRTWNDYLDRLGKRFDRPLDSLDVFLDVLKRSHDYFADHGAVASDHGMERPATVSPDPDAARAVFFKRRFSAQPVTALECEQFQSFLLHTFAQWNAEKNWVMQLHIGAVRDLRDFLMNTIGHDAGGDVSDHNIDLVRPLANFLNPFDGRLKVVLYCLEPGHQASLAALSRAFGVSVRLGSAWWLNDTPAGMTRQLEYIPSIDLLSAFAGMVSDSRKLLSYASRFEMFRRVLCNVVGGMVRRGQIPADIASLLVRRVAYSGPKEFFSL